MKRLACFATMSLALLAGLAGCDRNQPAEEPAMYDPALDGAAERDLSDDQNLLADQKTISRAYRAAMDRADTAPPEADGNNPD